MESVDLEERHLDTGNTEANSLLPAAWTPDRFAKVGGCGGTATPPLSLVRELAQCSAVLGCILPTLTRAAAHWGKH